MRADKTAPVTKLLRSLALGPDGDADLVRRFATEHNEEAFHAIVRRHGGLVLDVCQAVLRNRADAEDAFQATFVTLSNRVGAIRSPKSLAAWLHGTAYRIAKKARSAAARRRRHETAFRPAPEESPVDPSWAEVRQAIHEEVNRLPAAERSAIVLCYLMGHTQDESARRLGLSKDGVKKRLERGREMLRVALTRRGFGPAAMVATAAMPLVAVPRALAETTAQLAIDTINGSTAGVSESVAGLIERGSHMFSATKVLITSNLFAAATVLAIAVSWDEPTAIATAAPRLPERKDPPPQVKTELDGTWKVVAIEDNGKEVATDDFKGLKFTFKNGKLVVGEVPQDKELTWSPQYLNGAEIKLDADKKPKEIDLKLDPKVEDKTIHGIYQIFKGQLKIGVRTLKSADLPRPKGYATVSGTITSYTLELEPPKPEGKK